MTCVTAGVGTQRDLPGFLALSWRLLCRCWARDSDGPRVITTLTVRKSGTHLRRSDLVQGAITIRTSGHPRRAARLLRAPPLVYRFSTTLAVQLSSQRLPPVASRFPTFTWATT